MKNRLISNPFRGTSGYNCFGCSPDNPIGLALRFVEEGDILTATWTPEQNFEGYNNLLHGGIQATLMDEIASWFVYVKMKTAGVTSKLEVRYKQPVYTNRGDITLRATLKSHRRNLVDIDVELLDNQDRLCAKALVQYFTFPEKIAREKFFFPASYDKFFEGE